MVVWGVVWCGCVIERVHHSCDEVEHWGGKGKRAKRTDPTAGGHPGRLGRPCGTRSDAVSGRVVGNEVDCVRRGAKDDAHTHTRPLTPHLRQRPHPTRRPLSLGSPRRVDTAHQPTSAAHALCTHSLSLLLPTTATTGQDQKPTGSRQQQTLADSHRHHLFHGLAAARSTDP